MRELNASTNFLCHGPERIAHFGMGDAGVADEIRAEWTTGDATVVASVEANQHVVITSPTCMVSDRNPRVFQTVTASGVSAEPIGHPRDWLIDSQVLADPVSFQFSTPGTKELMFRLYDPSGETIVRTDIVRVEVIPEPVGVGLH